MTYKSLWYDGDLASQEGGDNNAGGLSTVATDETISGNGKDTPLAVAISTDENNTLVIGKDKKLFVSPSSTKIPEIESIDKILDNQKIYHLIKKDGDNEIGFYVKDSTDTLHIISKNGIGSNIHTIDKIGDKGTITDAKEGDLLIVKNDAKFLYVYKSNSWVIAKEYIDKKQLEDIIVCTSTVIGDTLPNNIPVGEKVFNIINEPEHSHKIMVSSGLGVFVELEKNTLNNHAVMYVKDTDSKWHYNVQTLLFKKVEITSLKTQFSDAITNLGLADGDKNTQKAIEAMKLLIDGLPDQITTANIATRDAIGNPTANSLVHVLDAKDDTTVTKGWCKYQYINGDWVRYLAEEDLNILDIDDVWFDKLNTNYATKGMTSPKQLDEWFKGKSVDGLWGSPVENKEELRKITPKDDSTRSLLSNGNTYRFKFVNRLSATEKTDTANITPNAPNDVLGMWVVSKESILLTETIGRYDGSGDGTLQILNDGLTWNGLKSMGFTHITLMGEVLINATNYPIESTTITTKDEMGKPVTYFNFTQDDATTNTVNQILTMKIQTTTQANTGSLDTYHSESGIHHVNITVIGHRGFEQKQYIDQNTVEVENVPDDEVLAVNINTVGTSKTINFKAKPSTLLFYGSGESSYKSENSLSFKYLKSKGTLSLLLSGRNNESDLASDNTEVVHILYKVTYISDTKISVIITKKGYIEAGAFQDRASYSAYKIDDIIAMYKTKSTVVKPTIINPSAAIVPNGYEIKIIKGTTNPNNSVLDIDISAEIPDGKEILGVMSSKIDYSTGFVTPDTVGSIDYQIFMSSATNLRIQGITSSGLYNKPFNVVLQLANKNGGYTQGTPEGGGIVQQDMSAYMLKTDYDINNNKTVDFVDEETDGGVI